MEPYLTPILAQLVFKKGFLLCALRSRNFQEEDSQHAGARPERNGSHGDGGALHDSPTGGGGASLADVKAARAELEMGAQRLCFRL